MLDESERTMATRILTTAEEQENLAEIGDRGRMLLAQGYTGAMPLRSTSARPALIRNACSEDSSRPAGQGAPNTDASPD